MTTRRALGALPLPPNDRAELWAYAPRLGFRRLVAIGPSEVAA
jgi:hypothetical protein